MKLQKRFLSLFLILCIALSGCKSPGENKNAADEEQEETEPLLASAVSDEVIDDSWKKTGFVVDKNYGALYGGADARRGFKEIRYLKIQETAPDFDFSSKESQVSYLRNIRYELITYIIKGGDRRYFLETRISDSAEVNRIELFANGDEKPAGRALNLDAVTESDIALLFMSDDPYVTEETDGEKRKRKTTYYQIVHVDADGQVTSRVNVSSCYKHEEINDSQLGYYWWCDERSYSYAINFKEYVLYIYDDSGNMVMKHRMSADRGENLPAVCHAPDGSLLFTWGKNSTSGAEIYWFDTYNKTEKLVGTLTSVYLLWSCTMEKNGQFLYGDTNYAQLWDTQAGSKLTLLNYADSTIPYGGAVRHLSITPEGELLLYLQTNESPAEIIVMSDKTPEEMSGPTLVDFAYDSFTNQAVGLFNREQPITEKVIYSAVTAQDSTELENEWTRVMAAFAAGHGPDILCLRQTDTHMDTLWEKGALADLTTWVPKEAQEDIFPGLLACGVIDGKLAGICVSGRPEVLITTDEICPGDSWSQLDVLNIVKNNPDLEGIYISYFGSTSPSLDFRFMALEHPENSLFIDFENSESHFEREEFTEILELCKKCPRDSFQHSEGSYIDYEWYLEALGKIREKKYLAMGISISPVNFAKYNEALDGHARYVGFPGQTDYVGYWSDVNLILVNARTAYPEIVKKFLAFYTSDEAMTQSYWVLNSKPATIEAYHLPLVDLNPFTEEDVANYIELLRKFGPEPRTDDRLNNLISEEAETFFAGGRDAKGTADIIDNRVQLYLNERQ